MEKKYKTIVTFFIATMLISIAGFYKSYFQFFPYFENIALFTHIHFLIFLSWFAILISQPILIKQNKYALHRKVGRFSYFLAPIMVLSIFVMVKLSVTNNLSVSKEQVAIASAGAILDAVFFSILYGVSMANKQKIKMACRFSDRCFLNNFKSWFRTFNYKFIQPAVRHFDYVINTLLGTVEHSCL